MTGRDIVRYLRWIAVNDQAVMCPQLAKEAADYIEAAIGLISTYSKIRHRNKRIRTAFRYNEKQARMENCLQIWS